jgi:tol-pal system protein YbgF
MKRVIIFCLLITGFAALPLASAGTKEDLMRLQKDVQALRDQLQEIDKSFNEKMDGIKSLVVQLNDQAAKSNLILEKIPALLENQNANARGADDVLLKELSKVSAKLRNLDDLSTRISAMALQLNEIKMLRTANQENSPAGSQSPGVMFSRAYNDFVLGNLDLAIQEFNAFIDTFPGGDQAADALLYLGDAYLQQKKLPQANTAFTRVINNYSETIKVASALYKRAKVELDMKETQNAIDDLKSIVDKYPTAQDAENAKAKLLELGVSPAPKPEPTRRKTR